MNQFADDVKAVIRALARSENALALTEFVSATQMPVSQVSDILDFLVTIRIFKCDNSFERSEIGDMVYMFAENNGAQLVARAFEEEHED